MRCFSPLSAATILATLLSVHLALPARAHHSFSAFDLETKRTIEGTVRKFDWTNPHSYLDLTVANTDGTISNWSLEIGSVTTLSRNGWTKRSFKAGDKVTVVYNPLRDGTRGGYIVTAATSDGHVLAARRNR